MASSEFSRDLRQGDFRGEFHEVLHPELIGQGAQLLGVVTTEHFLTPQEEIPNATNNQYRKQKLGFFEDK